MNIAELRQAPPETSQYLDAQLLVIGLAKVVNTPRGQRCVQELQVIDRQGQKETIGYWYDVDKPDFAMPPQQINQWMRWKVKTKPKGQYLNISGYPEKQVEQAAPGSSTQLTAETQAIIDRHRGTAGQQIMDRMQPQPDQRVPSEWDKPIDWHDKKQLYIVRQSSIKHAIELLTFKGVNDPTFEDVLALAKCFSQFVYDGIVPGSGQSDMSQPGSNESLPQGVSHITNPDYSENPDPPPGDGVPF